MLTDIFVAVCLIHFGTILGNMVFVLIGIYEDQFWGAEDTMLAVGTSCIPVYNLLVFFGNIFYSIKYFVNKLKRKTK